MRRFFAKLLFPLGAHPPVIGAFLPWSAKPTGVEFVGCDTRREYRVVRGGHEFNVTATRWRIISTVHAPADFVTPEGAGAGARMRDVEKAALGPPRQMGRGFWVLDLPSGWQAGFRADRLTQESGVDGVGQWIPVRRRAA